MIGHEYCDELINKREGAIAAALLSLFTHGENTIHAQRILADAAHDAELDDLFRGVYEAPYTQLWQQMEAARG